MGRVTMTILKGNELVTYDRENTIWQMRLEGYSLRDIAAVVGLSHVQVLNIINARLADMVLPNLEEHIKLEVERLEVYIQALMPKARAGDVQAIMASVRVADRKAKLLGLDAAPKPVTMVIEEGHRFAWDDVYDAVTAEATVGKAIEHGEHRND